METNIDLPAQGRPASLLSLVGIYLAGFIALVILLNIVMLLVPFDNPAMGLLIIIGASGVQAHYWTWREKAIPANGRAWRVAALCGTISAFLSIALIILGGYSVEQMVRELQSDIAVSIALFAFLVVLEVLMARFGLWLTFRQTAKLMEKQAAAN